MNEARFARAQPIDALTAQSLRRITSEGASSQAGSSTSPTSYFTNSPLGHQPATPADPQSNGSNQYPAIPALDGSAISLVSTSSYSHKQPAFNIGCVPTAVPDSKTPRPNLSLLTDVSRRYPGFPTPLSPTLNAMELYPTPTSGFGSRVGTPRTQSPAVRSVSPMSVDGSKMCGPSARCMSHSYEHFAEQMGNIDSILAQGTSISQVRSPSRNWSTASLSPTSPQRALSPRAGILRNMATRQALRDTHGAVTSPDLSMPTSPNTRKVRRDSLLSCMSPALAKDSQSVWSLSPHPDLGRAAVPPPSIQIANGTEFEIESPISPTGTLLSYTSNRAIDSGLLAVSALSEPQVAEYRFWVPCGRRVCAFGCGGAHEGESAAAKRLFKGAENLNEQEMEDAEYGHGPDEDSFQETPSDAANQETRYDCSSVSFTKPVDEWTRFLRTKERDVSVARV